MTHMRTVLAIVAVLAVSACGESAPPPADAPAETPAETPTETAPPSTEVPTSATTTPTALDSEGLRLVSPTGSTLLIAFGQPAKAANEALTAARGAPAQQGLNSECGAGPLVYVNWADGLTAYFQNDAFAGWAVNAAGPTTMSGVGIGSTRAEMEDVYAGVTVSETTLGQEFAAGQLYGILDGPGPQAKITAMWSGVSCNFR